MRSTMRFGLCAVAVVMAVVAVGASSAVASEPWWHVDTISAPASQPGGEGALVLEVSNLGDAAVNGIRNPVTIVDTLPVGVTPVHIHGEGGGSFGAALSQEFAEVLHCSSVARVVTCTYAGNLLAYERFMINMTVEAQPGAGDGLSEVSVTGGGAPPVVVRRTLALDGPPPAFGLENYELTPEEEGGAPDTQAGSHPFQLTATLAINAKSAPVAKEKKGNFAYGTEIVPEVQPVDLAKDLRFNLPPGLLGNPTPLPKCPLRVFLVKSNTVFCPDDTVVGVATAIVINPQTDPYGPLAVTSSLYNLQPAYGEPARFGFNTSVGPIVLDTSVATGGDYHVVVSVPNIPSYLPYIASQVTFWGVPGDARHDTTRGLCLGVYESRRRLVEEPTQLEASCPVQEKPQPFLIQPTSCTGPLQTSVEGDSWSEIGKFTAPKRYTFSDLAGEQFAQDGCNDLSFEPSIKVAPDSGDASTPTGLSVAVHVGQEASLNPTGLADATVKDTSVTLPAGVGLNPAGADGLSACTTSDVALGSPAEQECPESSKVGTVEIHTPLLPEPLVGAAYLATQNANPFGSLVALYLVANDPVAGVRVKLAGEVKPDPATGQLVSTFKETPQLPFEELDVHFFGGSRAPLGSPALCGGYTTTASIAPWSGREPVASSSEFDITAGPNGSPCASPLPFAPELTAGTTSIQAGGFSPFSMTMSREDGNQNLQGIQLHMPPGLLGTLSGVALCGEPQADAGTCGAESLIGETTVSVGLGGNPYSVKGGKVYITGPYDGAPYGLSIVNPAKAGPFNLGSVIVRAKIEVNPSTAALTITTDPSGPYAIPHILDGIPLQIKHVNVLINRPDFTFNPTNCSKLAITGSLESSEGDSSALSVPFQATNCAVLAFKPKLTATSSGKTSRLDGASLNVKLAYPAGPYDANIARVKVELPRQLPSRLPTLQKACLAATFEANPANCPPASIIGHATATTPVIPVPLTGPAYFVSHGGEAFPSLIIVLQGYGATVDLVGSTFISKAGVTSSTFKTIPDVPVGTFELTLPQGPYSALATDGSLCQTKNLAMPTEFVGQNGAEIHTDTKIAVTGCPKAERTAHKKKHHLRKKKGHRKTKG